MAPLAFRDLKYSIYKGIGPSSMAISKSSSGVRNCVYPALLPPKSPVPSLYQTYVVYVSNPTVGLRPINKSREEYETIGLRPVSLSAPLISVFYPLFFFFRI